jgi:hypothetical protein
MCRRVTFGQRLHRYVGCPFFSRIILTLFLLGGSVVPSSGSDSGPENCLGKDVGQIGRVGGRRGGGDTALGCT